MDVSFNIFPTIKMSKLTSFSICAACQTSKRWPKFLHCEVMMLKMYFSLHTKCTFFFFCMPVYLCLYLLHIHVHYIYIYIPLNLVDFKQMLEDKLACWALRERRPVAH